MRKVARRNTKYQTVSVNAPGTLQHSNLRKRNTRTTQWNQNLGSFRRFMAQKRASDQASTK